MTSLRDAVALRGREGSHTGPRPAPLLTPAQETILQLVSDGLTNKEIAQVMAISPNTVKCQIAAIFERLDVRSRTQAAVQYVRRAN